ncbi:5028_t:CDS:1 [Scutellospora calospora]|uniref:5028_t:CDS:1 n=1 Tax=Scutellospora calospora TaxID=85575 RepID=A0ACA9L238_9GLOM|nr:5028_t:CDS:1 [Scutellospora calospora]
MPSILRKLSFNIKKYFSKLLSNKQYENLIYKIATSTSLSFSYLHFFNEEFQADIAELLKKGPTVHRVVEIIVQNIDLYSNMLATHKIKPIRFDKRQVFNIEVSNEEE